MLERHNEHVVQAADTVEQRGNWGRPRVGWQNRSVPRQTQRRTNAVESCLEESQGMDRQIACQPQFANHERHALVYTW